MNIFSRFALRSLARNRTRTAVSIFGIALSCALICAVLTSVVSMTTMLYERTAADEGSWQVEAAGITSSGMDKINSDGRVDQHLEVAELGAVSLGDENAQDYGSWLFTKTWPQNPQGAPVISTPEITSGRAPEAPGEVVLPHYLENVALAPCGLVTEGTIALGSNVTFELGTRTIHSSDAGDDFTYIGTSSYGSYTSEDMGTESFDQNLGTLELTVVGFYRAYGFSSTRALQGNSAYVYPEAGAVDQALADGTEATSVFSILTVHNPSDATPFAEELAASGDYLTDGVLTHTSLLRWQGVTGSADIWNTLYSIAAILAVVIVVAGVSLVYNSFAISVAERTRQFGLLSSLGASRRQLRGSVIAEALVLAAVGIPVGIMLGLLGCVTVFHFTGEGLASMFDVATYGSSVRVIIHPIVLAISAALALVTVLISAWIPAVRASRVSAVDAIRQSQDIRLTRRSRRALTRKRRPRSATGAIDTRPRGIAARLFGIPGFIAHRNLSRSTSKGRVTVAALAVSVALLIIAGNIGEVLSYASGTALNTLGDVDLEIAVDATTAETGEGPLTREDGKVNGQVMQDELAKLYARAQDIEGAEPLGYSTEYVADAIVPETMIGKDGAAFFDILLTRGAWSGPIYVEFIDDATWRAYIEELGLSTDEYCDPGHPLAVALNSYDMSSGGSYSSYEPLASAGTIQSITFADMEGYYASGVVADETGDLTVWYNSPDGDERFVPLSEGIASSLDIEVGALTDQVPAGISTHTNTLTIMLPASAISLADDMGFSYAYIRYNTDESADVASKAQDAFGTIASDFPGLDCTFSNYAQSTQQQRMMSQTVQTFIYCFTIITGLIAVANVFNTLTTSLILRRREFAVLKSIGMGNRAFRRMIAYECASYALRGFAIGFTLAAVAAVFMYQAMQLSFSTYQFGLPWLQIALSAAVVLVVVLVSVVYALRRSRSSSVVEALREDAI